MKKRKVLGAIAGVMAIAIAAGATYAWFTSTADPVALNVNTAKISITSQEFETNGDEVWLPSETVTFDKDKDGEPLTFPNSSTRESVVELSVIVNPGGFVAALGSWFDAGRLEYLNSKLVTAISGIDVTHDQVFEYGGKLYVWLYPGEQINDFKDLTADGLFVNLTIPKDLGGNTPASFIDKDGNEYTWLKTDNFPREHEATINFTLQAKAVQGTYDAISEVFENTDIADAFVAYYGTVKPVMP